jgi:hypothetical protein
MASTTEPETGINPDGMQVDDLMTFHAKSGNHPVRKARELFPDRPAGYVAATRKIRQYAAMKASAMDCRQRGEIDAARVYEAKCDSIHDSLPEFARW